MEPLLALVEDGSEADILNGLRPVTVCAMVYRLMRLGVAISQVSQRQNICYHAQRVLHDVCSSIAIYDISLGRLQTLAAGRDTGYCREPSHESCRCGTLWSLGCWSPLMSPVGAVPYA